MSLVGLTFQDNDLRFKERRLVVVLREDCTYVYVRNIKTGRETRILKSYMNSKQQKGWIQIEEPTP